MKKKKFILIVFFISVFFNTLSSSQISNKIIVKVGSKIITAIDLQNEILTTLLINKEELNQNNIDKVKNFAIKNLINKTIKKIEIERYEINSYNKSDLQEYLNQTANLFNTNIEGLEDIFTNNKIDYQIFINNYQTELLWNSLIFNIYINQININMVDVENEIESLKKEKNEEEITSLRKKILNQKKEEKLNLFSRSHFTNLENSIPINFK